jgi:uncharacterized protein (DUF433 family)
MTVETGYKHIVRTPGFYEGRPCIEGHKISVHDIAVWTWQGQTPEEIARDFQLTLAEVHAALTYYYDHKDEIDREIEEHDAFITERADADTSPIAERMRQLLAEKQRRASHG